MRLAFFFRKNSQLAGQTLLCLDVSAGHFQKLHVFQAITLKATLMLGFSEGYMSTCSAQTGRYWLGITTTPHELTTTQMN